MNSKIGYFYRNIIYDKMTCVSYLKISHYSLPQNAMN